MVFDDIAEIDLDALTSEAPSGIKKARTTFVQHIWPLYEGKREPNEKQWVFWNWGHKHPKTVIVALGAPRSGKTVGIVAKVLETCLTYPGTIVIVGSMDYEHLKTSIIKDFENLLSVKEEFDSPVLKKGEHGKTKKLNRENKELQFKNGSIIRFCNLKLFIKTLGTKADIIVVEEAPTLPDEEMLDVLFGRLSNTAVPWKMMVLTGNPLKKMPTWIKKRFNLDTLRSDYDGPPKQIGKPCPCQYCLKCLKHTKQRIERINGLCPVCGYRNKSDCPGNQLWQQVVLFQPKDNDKVPDTLDADNEAAMDEATYRRMGAGHLDLPEDGKCYPLFSLKNVLGSKPSLDPKKDLIWAMDFNSHPQCSIICQEYDSIHPITGVATTEILAVDEIVKWNWTIKRVAREFIRRYKPLGLQGKVLIYGDPAGWIGKVVNEDDEPDEKQFDNYTILIEALEKAGFDVECRVPHTTFLIQDRITNVNFMLEDGDDYRRVKISPACEHLIASLEDVVWDPNGSGKEWEAMDRKAKKSGEWTKVHPMTHPAAAFGYYLLIEHPIYPYVRRKPFVGDLNTGEFIEARDDGELHRFFANKNDYKLSDDDDLDLEDLEEVTEDDYTVPAPKKRSASLFRMSDYR